MIAGMPRFLRGAHDLPDEALGALGRRTFVADVSRLNADVILAPAHLQATAKSGVAR